jgi:hypothetical protein
VHSGRKFTAVDSYVHERLVICASRKHGLSGRNWSTRFTHEWTIRLGVFRLSGNVHWRTAHATHPTINYRIHDVDTEELLGFGFPRRFRPPGTAVQHFQETQAENPGRHIIIRTYDEAAYFSEQ